MIDDRVRGQAARQLTAEFRTRNVDLVAAMKAEQARLVPLGVAKSSRADLTFQKLASDELSTRAGMIWNALTRAQRAFGSPGATLADDLRRSFDEFLQEHAVRIGEIVSAQCSFPTTKAAAQAHVKNTATRLSDIYGNEAEYFAHEVNTRAANVGSTSITQNFNGPVGVVQNGAGSVAHVNISQSEATRIADALLNLRNHIEVAQDLPTAARAQLVEVVDEAKAAVTVSTPNPAKVGAIVSGLGNLVQTVASLRPAWEVVRDAVTAVPGLFS